MVSVQASVLVYFQVNILAISRLLYGLITWIIYWLYPG